MAESQGNAYSLISFDPDTVFSRAEFRLVRLAHGTFFDLAQDLPFVKEDNAFAPVLPLYIFGKIEVEKDLLHLRYISYAWVVEALRKGRANLQHTIFPDNTVLITATTSELQQFIQKYADSEDAFAMERWLCRKGSLDGINCTIAVNERKVANVPSSSFMWHNLGESYLKGGLFGKALTAFEKAQELDPHGPWLGRIAFTYFLIGDFENAVASFNEYFREFENPTVQDVLWYRFTLQHLERGDGSNLRTKRELWSAWELALADYQDGRIGGSDLRRYARTPGEKCQAHLYGGYSDYLLKGNIDEALHEFRFAIETGATNLDEYLVARARLDQFGKK